MKKSLILLAVAVPLAGFAIPAAAAETETCSTEPTTVCDEIGTGRAGPSITLPDDDHMAIGEADGEDGEDGE